MARHSLPATKERIGFGEGVHQAQELGARNKKLGAKNLSAMPHRVCGDFLYRLYDPCVL